MITHNVIDELWPLIYYLLISDAKWLTINFSENCGEIGKMSAACKLASIDQLKNFEREGGEGG